MKICSDDVHEYEAEFKLEAFLQASDGINDVTIVRSTAKQANDRFSSRSDVMRELH